MFNPQGSFSVQSFPLKPVEQSSKALSWSSGVHGSQNPIGSYQSAVAGPSSTKSTTPTSPDGPIANLAVYRKDRSEEELQVIQQTAAGFAACLAADHAAVLQPDVDTPFTDVADVVNRLLPYHVFQQPDEDLNPSLNRKRSKGKEKATNTRFALNCHRRLKRLEDRLCRTKIRTGTRPSPDGQAYVLAQSILEVERSETATVSSELRNARNELDAIQREKRAASDPTSTHATVTTFRPTYYTQATPSQYYRTYSYAYTHQYSTGAQGTSTLYSPLAMPQMTAGTSNYTPSTSPIPVQLPVTSLSALHALGIVPVPAASMPPPDQPQPAAILKGSTSNGAMLSLEINVSLLQSAQMSGLAILLNSLMSRGAGTGQASAAYLPLRAALSISYASTRPTSRTSSPSRVVATKNNGSGTSSHRFDGCALLPLNDTSRNIL
ncbi:hypothetical protein HD554DRAFT_2204384 [Boletus coccyginus]|nr:hypothetical protein HD554DRAFT_2204384 [Boletus coccyginus]